MKLSTIICMKQRDKQGHEGSRCKLSRNLCSTCYFGPGCCGRQWASHPARFLCPGGWKMWVGRNKWQRHRLMSLVLSGFGALGWARLCHLARGWQPAGAHPALSSAQGVLSFPLFQSNWQLVYDRAVSI